MTHEGIDVLDRTDCYNLLKDRRLGRVGVKLADELLILPVYYALVGEDIVFRTSPGTKLDAAVLHTSVAFEVDNDMPSWSVLVSGHAEELRDRYETENAVGAARRRLARRRTGAHRAHPRREGHRPPSANDQSGTIRRPVISSGRSRT